MTVFVEGDLQMKLIDDALDARRFDGPKATALSHCMKAVDFIVEFPDPNVSVYGV